MADVAQPGDKARTVLQPPASPGTLRLRRWLNRQAWRHAIIGVPYFWLLLFFLVPFFIVLIISGGTAVVGIPPIAGKTNFPISLLRITVSLPKTISIGRAISTRFASPPYRLSFAC
jgi:hypothetical protein